MKPSEDQKLLDILKYTAEIYGKNISLTGAVMFLTDIDNHTSAEIILALSKCRKELRTFPTVADVIARIASGRPGVEEAWMLIPKDEESSVIWNNEIAEAYGVCRGMIQDDLVAARMAFKESYLRIVSENTAGGKKPDWFPSFGFDQFGRSEAVRTAIDKGRITQEYALVMFPEYESEKKKPQKAITSGFYSLGGVVGNLIEHKGGHDASKTDSV